MKWLSILIALNLSMFTANAKENLKKELDTDASVVKWEGKKKLVDSKHTGKIKIKEGSVIFKGDAPQSAEITIDMKSITNDDIENEKYKQKLVDHLQNADFFDVSTYPTAVLTVKKFAISNKKPKVESGEKEYVATGTLKIKDKTKKIVFNVKVSEKDGVWQGKGKVSIDRTLWNIRYGSGKFFKGLGDKVIADEILLDFNVVTKN